jgi:hypothetical protein
MTFIELEGAYNVRDLGGLAVHGSGHIRKGLVYRGDSLDHLTSLDKRILFNDLRIRTVIDLRSPEEHPLIRDPVPPGVLTLNYPLLGEGTLGREPFPVGSPKKLAELYIRNLVDGRAAVVAALSALERSAHSEEPAIFHCAAGRDRTGVLAALLLSLLDVEEPEIAADYEASNRHASQVHERLVSNPIYHNGAHGEQELLLNPATIIEFIALLKTQLNGAHRFVMESGFSEQSVIRLREALIS